MPKKTRLMDTPTADLPPEFPFWYAKVPTKIMVRVETKREKEGHTVKHMLEKMCELYLKGA